MFATSDNHYYSLTVASMYYCRARLKSLNAIGVQTSDNKKKNFERTCEKRLKVIQKIQGSSSACVRACEEQKAGGLPHM